MELSNKYTIKEDQYNLTLYETVDVETRVKGKRTGNVEKKERCVGYYSPTAKGRVQIYNRVLNNEISDKEEQSLQEILTIVNKTSEEIYEVFDNIIKRGEE